MPSLLLCDYVNVLSFALVFLFGNSMVEKKQKKGKRAFEATIPSVYKKNIL